MGRGRGPPQGRGPPPRPPGDEPDDSPSLFTSIGRMVNTMVGVDDDQSVGTAQYPSASGVPNRASNNADEAQRRANEMSNAMSWLTNPSAPAEEESAPAPVPGSGLFTGEDNWWEKEDTSTISDEVSVFSNNTEFKTEDMPDLMTMLRQTQEENAKKRESTEAKKPTKKAPKVQLSTREAQDRTKNMAAAISWWKKTFEEAPEDEGKVKLVGVAEMKRVMDWWSAHQDYMPPSDKGFDQNKKKAMKVNKALGKYDHGELEIEKKAHELQNAVKWWQSEGKTHLEEMKDFEYNQSTFKRVNDLFGGWELEGLPKQKWKKFDPRDDLEETERRATDLQGCLGLVLSGHFDESHPHYAEAINHVKDIFVDSKFNENNSAKEMEDTLKWWKINASTYDPLNASKEDVAMFRKAKGLLAQFGF
jgi:hypothetical protein